MKRVWRELRRAAWFLGGQKTSQGGTIRVPPQAYVSESAFLFGGPAIQLSERVMVQPGSQLICAGSPPYLSVAGSISLGEATIVRENVNIQTFGGAITIGRECSINPFCVIRGNGGLTIGDNVLIAPHVGIFAANHVFTDPQRTIKSQGESRKGIVIGSDVWIGAGAIILDGVTVGSGSIIAAGALINRDVPPFAVVGGVPFRILKWRDGK